MDEVSDYKKTIETSILPASTYLNAYLPRTCNVFECVRMIQ